MSDDQDLSIMKSTDELIGPLNDIERKFAPTSLFLKGDIRLLEIPRRVSIIGTRHPTNEGIINAESITKFLVNKDVVIVSGLALGIDSVAHNAAIKHGGRTIAVLGTPLDKYYPPENRYLQDQISKNHLLISQFPQGLPVERKNFPIRNRTMALLSHISIIIEAGEGSGTLHQGWEALRLGRPLFIVESNLNRGLEWPAKLMEYGAQILSLDKLNSILENLPLLNTVDNVTF